MYENATATKPLRRLEITATVTPDMEDTLSNAALDFLLELHERFTPRLEGLLAKRQEAQARIDAGELPDFDPATQDIRDSEWTISGIPADLTDRRVEITGPADRKMIINALNSGAKVFMADLEDSLSPTWPNIIDAQRHLFDANRRSIDFTAPNGKKYQLNDEIAQLIVRVRGLHLPEKHMLVDGKPIPGALVDFALYAFHNLRYRVANGSGLYLYLPKLEHGKEAAWWNDVFRYTEERFNVARGSIKATVLIETLPAVFQMDEILYSLRDYIVGLNCGRWDYIFSFIKTFRKDPERVLPDRQQVGMTRHFLKSYSELLIKTCHRRGAFAMGGMAAQIPIKDDPDANEKAINAVIADKTREANDGHDGTWVAHPGLVPVALDIFDEQLDGPNQLTVKREDVNVTRDDLLELPTGTITDAGIDGNIAAALDYIAAWLAGNGCVPLNNLMEDAATAEIARVQLWQWVKYPQGVTENGEDITAVRVVRSIDKLAHDRLQNGAPVVQLTCAAELLKKLVLADELDDFLTLPAYDRLP